MADKEKIKRILRRNVQPGKQVTDEQLTQITEHLSRGTFANEALIESVAKEVTKQDKIVIVGATDMSDINN